MRFLIQPTFSKPNRTYQSLFVNGRYVINQNVSLAIFKAFENYIMKSTFPFYVLNLKLNLDKVDVNVHPNKLEVKFEKPNEVFGFVYSSVLNAIIKNNEPSTLTLESILPILCIQIPPNTFFNTIFKAHAWTPTKLIFNFTSINRISPIMSSTIFNKCNLISIRCAITSRRDTI